MTREEKIRECAKLIGFEILPDDLEFLLDFDEKLDAWFKYDPYTDDTQAMALVKKLRLWIQPPRDSSTLLPRKDYWFVAHVKDACESRNADLNTAIVDCAVAIWKARKG